MRYIITRKCGPKDWCALPHQFKAGDFVSKFVGYNYGLCRDDAEGGYEVVACTLNEDGTGPMFTVPVGLLKNTDGTEVCGEYINVRAPLKKLPGRK